MPTYEYLREDGTKFEVTQSMSEPSLKECPITHQPCKRIIPKRRTPIGFKMRTRGTEHMEWY